MRCMSFVSVALAITVAAGCNRADRNDVKANTSALPDGGQPAGSGDAEFLYDIALAQMGEIALSRMAIEQSANAQIKVFAQMMVADHTTATDTLTAIASQHSLTLPSQLAQKHLERRDKLSTLQGPEFDQAYLEAMVDAHVDVSDRLQARVTQESLADFSAKVGDRIAGKAALLNEPLVVHPQTSDDPVTASLNQWAADTFPAVHKHLSDAKQLDSELKGKRPTT